VDSTERKRAASFIEANTSYAIYNSEMFTLVKPPIKEFFSRGYTL